MTVLLLLADAVRALCIIATEDISQELLSLPTHELVGGPASEALYANTGARQLGDILLERWDAVVNDLGVTWHKDQRRLLNAVRTGSIPGIYGITWAANKERVCAREGIWYEPRNVLMLTPRRWGKSTAMGGSISTTALVRPYSIQSIFSTGKRASSLALAIVYKMICHKDKWKRLITTFNQETIELVFNKYTGDVRTVKSYPSNVRVSACARARGGGPRGGAAQVHTHTQRRRRRRQRGRITCVRARTHTAGPSRTHARAHTQAGGRTGRHVQAGGHT